MALARVKVWNPGDVLTASDLNGEFNNVLNNPLTLVSPTTGPINFNLQANTNLVPTAITATSGILGQGLTLSSSSMTQWGYPAPAALPAVTNLNGTLSSATATFTANQYMLQTTDRRGAFLMTSTDAFTVNIGTAGPAANGRDIAGQFASTFVHYYAITTGAYSTAPAGIVSSQPPTIGPTLPTGYSGYAYLCTAPYSSASTTLATTHTVRGRKVGFNFGQIVLNAQNSLSTATVSLSTGVPPNALTVDLSIELNSSDTSATDTVHFFVTSSQQYDQSNVGFSGAVAHAFISKFYSMPNLNNKFFYNVDTTSTVVTVVVVGYDVANGD